MLCISFLYLTKISFICVRNRTLVSHSLVAYTQFPLYPSPRLGACTSRIFFPGGESLFFGVPFPYPAPSRAGLLSTDKFAVSLRILN